MAMPLEQWLAIQQRQNGQWTPYDPTLAATIGGARNTAAEARAAYSHGVNMSDIQFAAERRRMKQQQQQALRQNADEWGSRGGVRSGAFAASQGKLGSDYQQNLDEAIQGHTAYITNLRDQKLHSQNAVRDQIAAAQADATNRANELKQQQAQSAADAEHQKALEALVRQQIQAEIAAANAYKQGMGPTGQSYGGGGGVDPNNPLAGFANMSPEALNFIRVMRYLKLLKQQQDQKKNPSHTGAPHYQ